VFFRSAGVFEEVVDQAHGVPAELATERGAVFAVLGERRAGGFQLVIGGGNGDAILLEHVLAVPDAHAAGMEGYAVDPVLGGEPVDDPRGETFVPAILVELGREFLD